MKMPIKTRKAVERYALTLPPGCARAQCFTISGYILAVDGETIAERIKRDHCNVDGHLRAATLLVDAGVAVESDGKNGCYGTFTFEDGSSF